MKEYNQVIQQYKVDGHFDILRKELFERFTNSKEYESLSSQIQDILNTKSDHVRTWQKLKASDSSDIQELLLKTLEQSKIVSDLKQVSHGLVYSTQTSDSIQAQVKDILLNDS